MRAPISPSAEPALALDPSFVLAHIGVAKCYTNMVFQGFVKLECVLGPALAAINRAIALDPASAPAHIALAQIQLAQSDILGCGRALGLLQTSVPSPR
jgi:hypothetical protein